MRSFLLIVGAALLQVTSAGAADCVSLMNSRCMRRSEVGGFSVYMKDGDPCFSYGGGKFCVTKITNGQAGMEPCSCAKTECGCGSGESGASEPKCDNSQVPQSFNCDSGSDGYCNPKYGKKHTMCKYCGTNKRKCGGVCQYGLSEEEKRDVLDKHNELRRLVAKGKETSGVNGGQPKAANMYKLSWDDELATIAQRWADQCGEAHDKNRNTETFPYVGQNVASKMSSVSVSDKNVTGMVMDWYMEVVDFPGANVAPYSQSGVTGVVGHYTQVAWGSTTKVGCGYIQHYPYEMGRKWYRGMMVCNYGPGGNMIGGEMYKVGKPGSQCPGGQDHGLCL